MKVEYFPDGTAGPVKEFLDGLGADRPQAAARLLFDLTVLGYEGLRSGRITVRPMGDGLWELKRQFDGIQYRIFFCVYRGSAWLLHVIEKKSARTPMHDLKLARKRKRGVIE